MKHLILALFVSCSLLPKKADKKVSITKLKEVNCEINKNQRFATRYDLLMCLSKEVKAPLHKVSLSFKDLPKSGPIANLTFYAISNGYLKPKGLNHFGAKDILREKEFNQFIFVLESKREEQ